MSRDGMRMARPSVMRNFLLGAVLVATGLSACATESSFRQRDPYGWPVPTWTAHEAMSFCYEQPKLVDFVNPTGSAEKIDRDDREGKYRVYRPSNDRSGWYAPSPGCSPDIAAIRAYGAESNAYYATAVSAPPPATHLPSGQAASTQSMARAPEL